MRLLPILLYCLTAAARAEYLVATAHGDEIPIEIHPNEAGPKILWLSSEFGPTKRRSELAHRLADAGLEVWRTDLHAAWFLPTGRYSLVDVDPGDIAAVIEAAVGEGEGARPVYLMAEGRSVALALSAVRHWQLEGRARSTLAGLLAFSPKLFIRTPQGGEPAQYLPVAGASNLPVYLLQPTDAGGFWRIAQAIDQLESGGSPVFLHRLPGVSDGFHLRPEFSDAEAVMTARLPGILRRATELLATQGGTPRTAPAMQTAPLAPQRPGNRELLRPYPRARAAPGLSLPTLDGDEIDLEQLRGKVVLVNFWASWCPPCVEEIPSLQRLYLGYRSRGLEILAVDVGEPAARIQAFLADKPVAFPVLLDQEAEAMKRWGVHAFPTTLILDRAQRIRYAVFGAFEWDSPEVIARLETLLDDAGRD